MAEKEENIKYGNEHFSSLRDFIKQVGYEDPLIFGCQWGASAKIMKYLLSKYNEDLEDDETKQKNQERRIMFGNLIQRVNIEAKTSDGSNPLHLSCQYNADPKIIELLMNTGKININRKNNRGITPLHLSCQWNAGYEAVEMLIQKGADVNIGNSYDSIALHIACEFKAKKEVVKCLINAKSKIDALNFDGQTPLNLACGNIFSDSYEIIQMLLENGSDPNIIDSKKHSILMNACQNDADPKIIDLLLQKKADIHYKTIQDETALFFACKYSKNVETLKILLEKGSKTSIWNSSLQYPIHVALRYQESPQFIQILVDSYPKALHKQDTVKNHPIHIACEYQPQNLEVLKIIIGKSRKEINKQNDNKNTPLHLLCSKKTTAEAVKLMLQHGAGVNSLNFFKETPLHTNCKMNPDPKVVEMLVKAGSKVNLRNKQGYTPLHIACEYQTNPDAIFYIVEKIQNLNITLPDSKLTPLHIACHNQVDPKTVDFLLKAGADPKIKDADGNNALHHCCMDPNQNIGVVKKILETKNNIFTKNRSGFSPFELAIKNNSSMEIIEALFNPKDHLNLTWGGMSPLHYICARKGCYNVVKILLESGQNPNQISQNKRTPLLIACANHGDTDVIQLLFDHGALCEELTRQQTLLTGLCSLQNINLDSLRLLLSKGANPNIVNISHNSPLHVLCDNPNAPLEAFELLINHKADASCFSNFKEPLHHLLMQKNPNPKVVDLLLRSGAQINRMDSNRRSFLHFAAQFCENPEITKILLDYRNDPNLCDIGNNTPLHTASFNSADCMDQVAQLLIEYGSDLNALNNSRDTPLHMFARMNPNFEVLRVFLENNADYKCKNDTDALPADYLVNYRLRNYFDSFSSLSDDLLALYENSEFTDYQINCFDGSTRLHKIFITLRIGPSFLPKMHDVFKSKLTKDVVDFVRFLYTGKTDLQKVEKITILCQEIGLDFKKLNTRKNLLNDLEKLFHDEESKDFTIIAQNEPIKVHKFILGARSDLYKGMFLLVSDDSNQVNDYSNISPLALRALIRFLYLDNLEPDLPNFVINDLYDATDYYQLNMNSSFDFWLWKVGKNEENEDKKD
ncbi:molting protein mlt-4 [Anaeramoeba ignava]|uniref:Molting protein mlt-4 n=1 Tax=Anaeramoeba ignava TaxID=1746090 RepID=A0A9Q0LMI5_ANAIG|nr:molting protein mlt-4 [Anaeramoeba ignava]